MDQVIPHWRDEQWWSAWLFPEQNIFALHIPVVTQVVVLIGLTVLFSALASLLPADSVFGYDWFNFFSRGYMPPYYPPWDRFVVAPLQWTSLVGLTIAAFSLAAVKRAAHPLSMVCAMFALPLLWTVFLGQLEGLAVLGLLALPWLTPLALVKPQVAFFGFLARRSHVLGLSVFLLISILLWGLWPLDMLTVMRVIAEGPYLQDISLKGWGVVIALPLMWWSRGDMDMLMLAGSFMILTLIPYNLLPAAPAIARLRPRAALLASLLSWLPLTANWLGPGGWWLGWVFVGYLWLGLAARRYPQMRLGPWLRRFIVE